MSEFEFLTGSTQQFLPFNSVPYTSVVTGELPSLAWEMKSRGYGGITAFHPGYATSYRRDKVYPLLGFNEHISSESIAVPERIRSFISDREDYNRLIEEYEKYRKENKDKPYFMFNVTIQNHGGYALDNGEVEPHQIEIKDSELQYEEVGQFLDLMKISDQQLERLVKYFSKVDEPTVIMLFGDHQPRVENEFYVTMYSRKGNLSEIEKQDMRYRVPFIIWANYDIDEQKNLEIGANYLQTLLLDTIGAPLTGFQKYQLDLMKKVPVISDKITIGEDGVLHAPGEATPYDEAINEYRILQYNMLVDRRHTVSEFFNLK